MLWMFESKNSCIALQFLHNNWKWNSANFKATLLHLIGAQASRQYRRLTAINLVCLSDN